MTEFYSQQQEDPMPAQEPRSSMSCRVAGGSAVDVCQEIILVQAHCLNITEYRDFVGR